jgi:citron Rho-interacting kinase
MLVKYACLFSNILKVCSYFQDWLIETAVRIQIKLKKMEPSKEPICVRIARLNSVFLGRAGAGNVNAKEHYLRREGLLDALILLYDECNNDALKKDRNIALFVEKCNVMFYNSHTR